MKARFAATLKNLRTDEVYTFHAGVDVADNDRRHLFDVVTRLAQALHAFKATDPAGDVWAVQHVTTRVHDAPAGYFEPQQPQKGGEAHG